MRFRRIFGVASVAALAVGSMVVLGEPAGANHVNCGATVTQNVTLDNDLLNCQGDGLRIQASNIVVDLGGRTISGRTDTNTTPQEFVGIRLMGVTGVTVRNGTVRNFDAGVVIGGGGGNTVANIQARNNINHSTLTGTRNPCNFGDGITVFNSDNNTIQGNLAEGNGPYGGITLVDDSDGNRIIGNSARHQNVDNSHPNFVTPERLSGNGPCGPFVPGIGDVGAVRQDIGIRIEGPGADNNRVEGNNVVNNDAFGITIHGYVCHPISPQQPLQANNGNNVVARNNVVGNGFIFQIGDIPSTGDGIAVPAQGPDPVVCVAHTNSILQNSVYGNGRHGIALGGRGTHDNNISGNVVRSNGAASPGGDGIRVAGPGNATSRCGEVLTTPCPGAVNNRFVGNSGSRNAEHDGHDGNPNCDNNLWRNNNFNIIFQGCERNSGG